MKSDCSPSGVDDGGAEGVWQCGVEWSGVEWSGVEWSGVNLDNGPKLCLRDRKTGRTQNVLLQILA